MTNPTTHNPKPFRRKAMILALAGAGALAFGPIRRAAACWFDPIIFDPQALVEHVQQIVQVGQEIQAAAQQVQNGIAELAHLNGNVAPNDAAIVADLQGQLDATLYNTAAPADQLNTRYPADMGNIAWAQYQTDESTWANSERQALVENRQLENQVYRDMDSTHEQVSQIVEASNSAPGETAAIQAHDDLMAVASGELAKLQALKAARSRLRTEQYARQQSELSFAVAEQTRARGGGDSPTPPTGTVADPFQN
jgi:P-type conjugative transfer protein TrbJ